MIKILGLSLLLFFISFPPCLVSSILIEFSLECNCNLPEIYVCFSASAANQKKPTSSPEKTDSTVATPQDQTNETKEDINGDDIASGEADVQISETTPEATDSLDTGIDETHLDTDQNKINEQNEKEEIETSSDVKTDGPMVPAKRKLQMQGRWRGVDPVIFYKDDAVVGRIMEFYGIKETLPFKGHLISRNSDVNHVKRIYYISNSVKEALELNLLCGQQLKIASVGLKMFVSKIICLALFPFSLGIFC